MATILEYKCPCCGGAIEFDSGLQRMKCPYCETEFDAETLSQFDEEARDGARGEEPTWEDYRTAESDEEWQDEAAGMGVYNCTSCGGQIIGGEHTAATSCPYCASPVILTGRLSGAFRPDHIIPFQLDRDAAKSTLAKFLSRKPLLPKAFRDPKLVEEVKGMYVPFWLFDCDADATIRYRATRVRSWSDANYHYTKTDHFLLTRAGSLAFDRVPVDGSSHMDDAYMESIEPYNYDGLTDFQMPYLAGYLADKYDTDAKASIPRANERIRQSTEDAFASTTVGYSTCVPESRNIHTENGRTRYALLPVWMLNTKYKGKTYSFAMNGQTGKFVGELPVSWGRFFAWLFGIAGGLSAIGTLIACLALL